MREDSRQIGNRTIDNLTYGYTQGNRLASVADNGDATVVTDPFDDRIAKYADYGFFDGASMAEEYTYDDNGNMITDANKGITSISYNHLNLPTRVVTPEGVVNYTYTSTGTKLTKFFDKSSGADETTDYIAGIQYKDDIRDFAPHAEGRYYFASGEYNYDLKDHLGNTRVTLDGTGTVVQRDDYYPFGMTFNSYNTGLENLYKFTGKESQPETGWVDFGARMYDNSIGRWNHIDPLAGKYMAYSPYNCTLNNPIKYIDPDGMRVSLWDEMKSRNGIDISSETEETSSSDEEETTNEGLSEENNNSSSSQSNDTAEMRNDDGDQGDKPNLWDIVNYNMNRITNGLLPDAQPYANNFDAVVIGGADVTYESKLTVLRGPDRGKTRSLGEAGFAIGLDVGVSLVGSKYYFTGNPQNLTIDDFNGFRVSGSIGMSAYVELGGGISIAPVASGGYIIGISEIIGASPPGPSGNLNVGFSDNYKK